MMVRPPRLFHAIVFRLLLAVPAGLPAQQARVKQKKIEREQKKREKGAQKEYRDALKRHHKNQSKETRAMMKKSKKNAKKSLPYNRK